MTERDAFETRLRAALGRYVAEGPSEFDALEFARTVASAEPRRHDRAASIAAALGVRWGIRRRSVVAPLAGWSPALRAALIVALVGLLLAATASALYVGSELLRRAEELAVAPPAEPIVSDTALGTITWRVDPGDFGDKYAASPVRVRLPADVGTPYGPVGIDDITDDTPLVWLGPDGTVEWSRILPAGDLSLAPVGDGLIAYGAPQGYGQEQAWPISWDGSRWVVGDELDVPPFLLVGDVQVAAGPRGVLIVGIDVAVAPDGQHFVRAPKPPGGYEQIGPVFATADGFIALVSPGRPYLTSDPPFEPVPWFSADGLTWAPTSSSSPFGEDSWIREVAGHDGRYVAAGNTGIEAGPYAVWASDDGRTWEPLLVPGLDGDRSCSQEDSPEGFYPKCTIGVTAGDAGWVIATGYHQSLWASADGRTWEPLSVPGISIEEVWGFLPQLALGGDTIVVTVGGYGGPTSAVGTIEP